MGLVLSRRPNQSVKVGPYTITILEVTSEYVIVTVDGWEITLKGEIPQYIAPEILITALKHKGQTARIKVVAPPGVIISRDPPLQSR